MLKDPPTFIRGIALTIAWLAWAAGGAIYASTHSPFSEFFKLMPYGGPNKKAYDLVDPAVLADSPAVLHGTVASCVEQLRQRRDEFGLDYFHMGGDPLAAAPVVARLA